MSRTKLQALVDTYNKIAKLDHRLFYGYLANGSTNNKVWYLQPFGEYSFQIGINSTEAAQYSSDYVNEK